MFRNYVFDSRFPCVGARSALNSGRVEFGTYSALGSEPSPSNRYAGTLKQTYKTEHRLRGAVGVDVHSRFGVNADARQAQRDSEFTGVNAMRKTKSAIHYAVHEAAKGMLKVGVTDLVTPPQLRSWNF